MQYKLIEIKDPKERGREKKQKEAIALLQEMLAYEQMTALALVPNHYYWSSRCCDSFSGRSDYAAMSHATRSTGDRRRDWTPER